MASYQYVYHMDGVSKTYPGGKKCFENIRLNFLPGVKIGVVGVNGAGKSTLLRIMAGIDKDYQGEAWAAKDAKVGYLSQEPYLDPALDVRGNVMLGVAEKQAKLDRYNELAMNYSDETAEEMARLQDEIDAENLWDLDSQVDIALEALRCPPDDADVETLSGGERRRVALCKLLLEAPDMLLLDEPTNHLDAETIAWLQKHLIDYKGTILIVTHDRYFLDDITSWILELERGRGIPYEGNYSSWLEQKAKRLEQEAREDKAKQKVMAKELEWIRAGAKARQAKSKARISAYEKMADQSEKERVGTAQIIIPNGPRLGGKVIELEGISKHYGDKQLIENLSLSIPPGANEDLSSTQLAAPDPPGRRRGLARPDRRRQFDAVQDDHRAGNARHRHRHYRRDGEAVLCRPVARRARPGEERLGGNLGRGGADPAWRGDGELAQLCRRVQLQGLGPAEEGGPAVGR